jgi:hypothetical protein
MRIASLAAFFAGLVAASAAHAQVPEHAVGFGVSLNPTALTAGNELTLMLPIGFGNIYLPIIAGPGLKVEPEFGILRTSSSSSGNGASGSQTGTLVRVGAGVFQLIRVGGNTALYVGPRVAMIRTSSSETYSGGTPTSSHQTSWSFGAAFGGEYFFSPHFSLGGEVQLNYILVGQPVVEPGSGSSSTSHDHMISNNGLIFVRLYF